MYTRTLTSRIESYFFFPLFILGLVNFYAFLPYFIHEAIVFPAPPVMVFDIFFLFLLIMWISVPLMGFRLNESMDIKKLLHYPIPFPILYLSTTLGNFFDVSSLLPLTFLASILNFFLKFNSGDISGFTGAFLLCILVFVFLQLSHQLVILILYNILPRFNPMKIMAFLLLAIVGFMVCLNLRVIKVPDEFSIFNDENLKFHAYLPTGYFGISFYEFWLGNVKLGYRFMLQSIIWIFPLLILNGFLTWATFRGVDLGIVRTQAKAKRVRKAILVNRHFSPKWASHPAIIIASIQAKTLLRDWHFIFYKMLPGEITPILILLIIKYYFMEYGIIRGSELFIYATIGFLTLIIILFLAQAFIFVGNIFGYDREAISVILASPVDDKTILFGKNLFMFCLLSVDALVISMLTGLFVSRIAIPLTFFCFMECMVIILVGLGNFSSIIYPYHVPFDKPTVSFQGTLIVAIFSLLTDMILLALLSPIAIGFITIIRMKEFIFLIPAAIAALSYSCLLYWLFLNYSSRILPRYREMIYQNVRTL